MVVSLKQSDTNRRRSKVYNCMGGIIFVLTQKSPTVLTTGSQQHSMDGEIISSPQSSQLNYDYERLISMTIGNGEGGIGMPIALTR